MGCNVQKHTGTGKLGERLNYGALLNIKCSNKLLSLKTLCTISLQSFYISKLQQQKKQKKYNKDFKVKVMTDGIATLNV